MSTQVQRIAHRGGSALAPENTLAAFRNALNLPVDAVEVDVHMSKDGHAVILHDNVVERMTDGTGNILDLDFAYLRSLNAAARFPSGWPQSEQIPTLREVLDLIRGRARIYIELKAARRGDVHMTYPRLVETVIEELRACDMIAQALVMSFDWSLLPQVRSLEPGIELGALVSTEMWSAFPQPTLESVIALVTAMGCQYVNMDRRLFSPEIPRVLHEHGLKLGLWTVNSQEDLQRFAAAGVDALTSDHPDWFARL